jgi:hypothetical protein
MSPAPAQTVSRQIMANVPSCRNVGYWVVRTRPLLEWMRCQHHATIAEVVCWGRDHGYAGNVIRNALAWLALAGRVRYDDGAGAWETASRDGPRSGVCPGGRDRAVLQKAFSELFA